MDGPTTRLRLRVVPGSGRTEVVGRYGDAWKVRVAAAPERGKANDAVVALVAEALGVPGGSVELLAGPGSRDKVVGVRGLSGPVAEERLDAAANAMRAGAR
jgi:uncharacterized protein YggU (UPF0235/DUF167 family)